MSPVPAVLVRVPATTSNIGPGFDAFGMALSLHLRVEMRPAEKLKVTADGADVPLDSSNLVVRTFLDALGRDAGSAPFSFHLRNDIPLARGVGSSATARVAGLALAEVVRTGTLTVDRARIAQDASLLEGHPDNATAAVHGGFCICLGELYERIEMDAVPYLVVIPEVEIHTEAARAALPRTVSLEDAVYNLQRAAWSGARIALHRRLTAALPFQDRLHQRHRLALEPRLEKAVHVVEKMAGVQGVFLSGSGPTFFVLGEDLNALGAAAERICSEAGLRARARTVQADNAGLVVKALLQ